MSFNAETTQKICDAFMKGFAVAKKIGYFYQLDNDQVDFELPGEKPTKVQEIWFIVLPEPPESLHHSLFREEFWRFDTQMRRDAGIPDDAICIEHELEVAHMVMERAYGSVQITNKEPFKEARRQAAA